MRRTGTSIVLALLAVANLHARVKLVALPERGNTVIRLDNPTATLIEEERVLTLQKGVNKVDFSWKGVAIDSDSIRLQILSHPKEVRLLNVSYPPNERALVWEIAADKPFEEKVRISYLLAKIDSVVAYKGVADKDEKMLELKSYLVLRNYSGEDFEKAHVLLDYGKAFEQGIKHDEVKRLLFLKKSSLPIEKVWTFDAREMPWDPEEEEDNVGIPVSYRIKNSKENKLGESALRGGKVRLYQQDGKGSTIFLGEERSDTVPVGEKLNVTLGQSRDIVVTQRKMSEKDINVRKNLSGRVVLKDRETLIHAEIENFKDKPAVLTMIQDIPGEWEMKECNEKFVKEDFRTLKFEIRLKPREKKKLILHYMQKNIQ